MKTINNIVASIWRYFTTRKASWRFARGCLFIGGSLVAGPLWLPFLVAAIENKTAIKIEEPSPWLGVVIILIGLLAIIVPEIIDYQTKKSWANGEKREQRKQDSEYAKRVRSLLPEETFEWFLHIIGDTHTMKAKHRDMLKKLETELASPESGFIDEEMNECAIKLKKAISSVLNFSAYNFFVPNNLHIRDEFWMFPEGSWDRGAPSKEQEARYGKLRRELNEHLDNLEDRRNIFLKSARDKLLFIEN